MVGESMALFNAVRSGTPDDVSAALDANAAVINRRITKTGGTPLFLAVKLGRFDVCQLLIDRGCDINCATHDGQTPLHIAAATGKVHIVDLLCRFQCNLELATPQGIRAIHFAVQSGHTKVVRVLVGYNCDINARTELGATPIFIAAQNGFEQMVKFLLYHKCDINLKLNKMQTSPLLIAAAQGHENVVQLLVDASPEIDLSLTPDGLNALFVSFSKGFSKIVDILFNSPAFDPEVAVLTAIEADNLAVVKLLLKRKRKNRDYKDFLQLTFAEAVRQGRLSIVQYIVEARSEIGEAVNVLRPGILAAVGSGNLEMVQYLLQSKFVMEHGADLYYIMFSYAGRLGQFHIMKELFERKTSDNDTQNWVETAAFDFVVNGALDYVQWLFDSRFFVDKDWKFVKFCFDLAAKEGQLEILKFLKTRLPEDKPLVLISAIGDAARHGHLDVVRYLLSLESATDEMFTLILSIGSAAAETEQLSVIQWLLRSDLAKPYLFFVFRVSLANAVEHGQIEFVKAMFATPEIGDWSENFAKELLSHVADYDQVPTLRYLLQSFLFSNADLSLTLLRAAKSGSVNVVQFLIRQGLNINVMIPEEEEGTALHLAASENRMEVARHLLASGCERNAITSKGLTPLHAAVRSGHVEMALLLLEEGCPVKSALNNGATTLHIGADSGTLEMMNLLLNFGADPNAVTNGGFTPLMVAVQSKNLNAVKVLIRTGCDVNAVADNGATPLLLAAYSGNVDVCRALVDAGSNLHAANNKGSTALRLAQKHLHGKIVSLIYNTSILRCAHQLSWRDKLEHELDMELINPEKVMKLFFKTMKSSVNRH